MTARSKVTLVEAARIRVYLIEHARLADQLYPDVIAEAVDLLLAQGLIDTDAALRALEQES